MNSPAHWGLEQWVLKELEYVAGSGEGVPFSPSRHTTARAYRSLPVVVLVLTEATSTLHEIVLEAVDFLQQASGGFRVVIFTDARDLTQFNRYGWPIEHFDDEASWHLRGHEGAWLKAASNRLKWVITTYRPLLVTAAVHSGDLRSLVERIATAFQIPSEVAEAADRAVSNPKYAVETTERTGWRGWLEFVPLGVSGYDVYVPTRGSDLRVVIRRSISQNFVLVEGGTENHFQSVCDAAARMGWNLVTVSVRDSDEMDPLDLLEASEVVRSTVSEPFLVAILSERHISAARSRPDLVDAVVWHSEAEASAELVTSYGRRLRGSVVAKGAFLERLEYVARTAWALGS